MTEKEVVNSFNSLLKNNNHEKIVELLQIYLLEDNLTGMGLLECF
jgi:hypothetical protein